MAHHLLKLCLHKFVAIVVHIKCVIYLAQLFYLSQMGQYQRLWTLSPTTHICNRRQQLLHHMHLIHIF